MDSPTDGPNRRRRLYQALLSTGARVGRQPPIPPSFLFFLICDVGDDHAFPARLRARYWGK